MKTSRVLWSTGLGLFFIGSYYFIADKNANPISISTTNTQTTAPMMQEDFAAMNSSMQTGQVLKQPLFQVNTKEVSKIDISATAQQVQNAERIKDLFIQASNNPSTSLNVLLKNRLDLTPSQREQLTQQAVEMIKRGELSAEQFIEQPES